MGIACQQSCYLIPDAKVRGAFRQKLKAASRKKLIKRRRNQMDSIFVEARVWALSMLLPASMFTNEPELELELQRLKKQLFGTYMSDNKIKCTSTAVAILEVQL